MEKNTNWARRVGVGIAAAAAAAAMVMMAQPASAVVTKYSTTTAGSDAIIKYTTPDKLAE